MAEQNKAETEAEQKAANDINVAKSKKAKNCCDDTDEDESESDTKKETTANNEKVENSKEEINKQPPPEQVIKKGDIVMLFGLKSKAHWNNQLAIIIAPFQESMGRFPIQTKDGTTALLKPENMRLYQKGGYKLRRQQMQQDDCCNPGGG